MARADLAVWDPRCFHPLQDHFYEAGLNGTFSLSFEDIPCHCSTFNPEGLTTLHSWATLSLGGSSWRTVLAFEGAGAAEPSVPKEITWNHQEVGNFCMHLKETKVFRLRVKTKNLPGLKQSIFACWMLTEILLVAEIFLHRQRKLEKRVSVALFTHQKLNQRSMWWKNAFPNFLF